MFPIHDVTTIDMAFGGDIAKLMPAWSELPEDYRRNWHRRGTWSRELVSDWFYGGLAGIDLTPRDGVDTDKALRHVKAVLMSFQPKHEHKEAACAWLLDQWFSAGTWTKAEKQAA